MDSCSIPIRRSGEGNVRERATGQLTNQFAQVWGEVNFAVKQITNGWKKMSGRVLRMECVIAAETWDAKIVQQG